MHNPFAPLIAIAPPWHSLHRRLRPGLRSRQCPLPPGVSASSPSAPVPAASGSSMNSSPNTARCPPPAPPMLSSIAWKPRPTTATQTTASPFGIASDAVVAAGCQLGPLPTLADTRIELKFKALTQIHPKHRAPCHPCDASCKKDPPDASQNLGPPPQPIEKQGLTTS
jgi:hypothetical protein